MVLLEQLCRLVKVLCEREDEISGLSQLLDALCYSESTGSVEAVTRLATASVAGAPVDCKSTPVV